VFHGVLLQLSRPVRADRVCSLYAKALTQAETLQFHFLSSALEVSQKLGVFAVDVWSKDEGARKFHLKYGILTLQDNPLNLYLPIGTVQQMLEKT